ncbi:SdpI family protein [Alteriqipengyuania sp. NZ-12B]|uniref:SdpI family protein n=1 Tax=Alteriqipengyuania abyssalis TaxID=2860200 RepID=A0ABS7PG93_9SPHN|nr:SdpI family protein [Alteriqipengyuania abyssalis]MBY8337210.1 SdpI family protein [Alteriqipengyuania abyssalis]
MKVRSLLLVNLLLVALMAGFAFWVAGIAPVGMELPTHWNAAGEVDQTMSPLPALLMPAGVSLFVALVFAVTPMLEPLQDKLDKSAPLLRAVWIGIMALFVALQGIIAAPVFGYSPGAGAIMLLVGLLFVVIGNTLPKSRPGFFVGIRTPWTITDEDNWVATHRLGGKLFMLAGGALVIAALLDVSAGLRLAVMLGGTLLAALVPVIYSWWFWRTHSHTGKEA